MILTGFAERGEVFGDPVISSIVLRHAIVIQIEGASYRLRQHDDLMPEHIRSKSTLQPSPIPPTLRRRGRPPKRRDRSSPRLISSPAELENFPSRQIGHSARH
jgi:hypothetical protein